MSLGQRLKNRLLHVIRNQNSRKIQGSELLHGLMGAGYPQVDTRRRTSKAFRGQVEGGWIIGQTDDPLSGQRRRGYRKKSGRPCRDHNAGTGEGNPVDSSLQGGSHLAQVLIQGPSDFLPTGQADLPPIVHERVANSDCTRRLYRRHIRSPDGASLRTLARSSL